MALGIAKELGFVEMEGKLVDVLRWVELGVGLIEKVMFWRRNLEEEEGSGSVDCEKESGCAIVAEL